MPVRSKGCERTRRGPARRPSSATEGSPQGRRRVVDGLLAAVHDAAHLKEAVKLAVIAPSFHAHAGGAKAGGIGLAFVA